MAPGVPGADRGDGEHGNDWVPLFQALEDAGIEVCLVNARHVRAVPGRKTDVCDAPWLRQLHMAGLLQKSFRPPAEVASLRCVMRHRPDLVLIAARLLQEPQKVLNEMNLKLHPVFGDLDGASAMAIVEAIPPESPGPPPPATRSPRRLQKNAVDMAVFEEACRFYKVDLSEVTGGVRGFGRR